MAPWCGGFLDMSQCFAMLATRKTIRGALWRTQLIRDTGPTAILVTTPQYHTDSQYDNDPQYHTELQPRGVRRLPVMDANRRHYANVPQ